MTKTYQCEELINQLIRQYPVWPSTFSACKCKRGMARGGGKCPDCIEEELANLIDDKLLAYRLHRAIQTVANLKSFALDKAKEND